jgi:small ligand-binding sensory domain FIST
LTRGRAERAAEDIAAAVGPVSGPDPLLLLFADSYHLEPEPLFRQLAKLLPQVRIVGGGASEDGSVGQVSVFSGTPRPRVRSRACSSTGTCRPRSEWRTPSGA